MSSPSIVFIQRYHQYYSQDFINSKRYKQSPEKFNLYMKKSNFYRCNSTGIDVANYLARNEACDKASIDNAIIRERLKEAGMDFSNYMGERPGSTGLFGATGDLDKFQMKEIKNELRNIKTNVYECVLSFTPEFSDVNLNSKYQAYELLQKVLPKYFLNNQINPNNINWFAAYHTNTDNRHIHLIWYEKTPTKLNEKGKPIELRFKEKDLTKMKTLIEMNTTPVIYEYEKMRDPVIDKASDFVISNPDNNEIKELKVLLKNNKAKQFNRLNSEDKKVVKNFLNKMKENCPEFKESYDNYEKSLQKTQDTIFNIYKENNVSEENIPKELSSFTSSRMKELDTRICNKILKTAYFNLPLEKEEKPKSFYSKLKYEKAKSYSKARIKRDLKNNLSDEEKSYEKHVLNSIVSSKNLKHDKTINYFKNNNLSSTGQTKLSDTDKYASSLIRSDLKKNYLINATQTQAIFKNLNNKVRTRNTASPSYSPAGSTAAVADALWSEAERKAAEEKKKQEDEEIIKDDDLEL